jgi:4-hydroxy-tetrahydrodipicolinate synthase
MTPESFGIGYSGDWGAKDALLAGGDCWYSVVAGLLPKPALALTRAAQAGNPTEAGRLDRSFAPLWAMFREFGSSRVMFAIAETLGLGPVTPPPPILPLGSAARNRVETALHPLLQAT